MKALNTKILASCLCLGACISSHATTTAISILPEDTRPLLTVPSNRSAVVRSIIVTNPGLSPVCDQQVLRGLAIKTSLCVPAGSSLQVEFSPALFYKGNESIDLKNGDSVTSTVFTINYRIIPPGKGLIEKEE